MEPVPAVLLNRGVLDGIELAPEACQLGGSLIVPADEERFGPKQHYGEAGGNRIVERVRRRNTRPCARQADGLELATVRVETLPARHDGIGYTATGALMWGCGS